MKTPIVLLALALACAHEKAPPSAPSAGGAGPASAATLFGASEAIRMEIGAPVLGPDRDRLDGAIAAAREAIGADAFAAAHQAGLELSAEQAVALAKGGSWPPLTPARPCANRGGPGR